MIEPRIEHKCLPIMLKSEAIARSMLNEYVKCVIADVGESVDAILLVGSLATGSYIPGPGDIDQITILKNSAAHWIENRVREHITRTMSTFERAINMAEVVYRRHHLERPWVAEWDLQPETKHLVTVPEELLRIHDHALVMYSDRFSLSALPIPNMDEMLDYAKRWKLWNDACQQHHPLPDPMPIRLMAQSVLSSAIWHYFFATGRTCFNKHEIAGRLRTEVPDYEFQSGLDAATRLRVSGFADRSDDTVEAVANCYRDIIAWSRLHPVGSVPVSGDRGKRTSL